MSYDMDMCTGHKIMLLIYALCETDVRGTFLARKP